MRILILGGQNKLGFQLVKSFSEDYDVFSWDKEEISFLDFETLETKINALKPDLIVNTTSYNEVEKCERENGLARAVKYNIELVAKLADISKENDSILIHFSNNQVFNGTKDKQYFTEEETPNPLNKYGETKAKGEIELIRRGRLGLNFYLVRYSRLFGPPGPENEDERDFFSNLLFEYREGKRDFKVIKEELANFTYTPDLAHACKRMWELKVPFGVYHLVNEKPATWYDAAAELFGISRLPVYLKGLRSEDLLKDARVSKYSILKNEKLKKMRPYNLALAEFLNIKI
ncbi:MAG: NAD(P)-dependent oxidoreductase [Patescibacteria group bacterium]|jgi:dTDP-4-dehydrorhamnose reductase|nr:NAD(P)-dependent oxidoreductase [Patescibacteria group bacterium]